MLHFIKKLIRTFVLSILDIEIKFKKNETQNKHCVSHVKVLKY